MYSLKKKLFECRHVLKRKDSWYKGLKRRIYNKGDREKIHKEWILWVTQCGTNGGHVAYSKQLPDWDSVYSVQAEGEAHIEKCAS